MHNGKEILVVDDEPIITSMLTAVLADEGYRVTSATSGADAIDRLASGAHRFRFLVVDVNLGGDIDGIDLAASMLADGANLSTIFMTGDNPGRHQVRAPAESIFLEKPFLPYQLIDAVRRLDRRVAA